VNAKVSVIIPTYNRAKTLERALKSVLAQTYRPIEIIVVNDGSTDDTDEVVEKFKGRKGVELKYIKQRQLERVVARNRGIEASTGEYICFLDDDDEFCPEKFARQVSCFKAHPEVDCLFTNCHLTIDGKGKRLFRKSLAEEGMKNHTQKEIVRRLCMGNIIPIINIMIKAAALKKDRFREDLLTHEDYELWLRLASKHRFDFIDDPLSIYHSHESESRYDFVTPRLDQLNVLLEYSAVFPENFDILFPKARKIKRNLARFYTEAGESDKLKALERSYAEKMSKALDKQTRYARSLRWPAGPVKVIETAVRRFSMN